MWSSAADGKELSQALRPWHDRLARAKTQTEVLVTVSEFLQLWLPADLAALPKALRPWRIFQADDVMSYAFALTRDRLSARGEDNPAVDLMAAFFADASMRLATLFALEPARSATDAESSR